MKIKSLILVTFLLFSNSLAFAKSNQITADIDPKLTNSTKNSEKSTIPPFDFDKIFAEAEAYFQAAKSWKKIKCEAKTGFLCTKRECIKKPVTSWIILDRKKEMVSRCEGGRCEDFSAEFKQTGVFINVQSEGPIGTLIRVLGDSRYKEIATIGLDAYITNGNCEVVIEK